jgi:hypothetical protein
MIGMTHEDDGENDYRILWEENTTYNFQEEKKKKRIRESNRKIRK